MNSFSPGQQLFVEFFHEALRFMGYKGREVRIAFEDFECLRRRNVLKSASFYMPVMPHYQDYSLSVNREWVEAVVEDKTPTVMRSEAYYHAYGFYSFDSAGKIIAPIPMEQDAEAFSIGLCLINGIPIPIPPFVTKEQILGQLSRFTHRNYRIGNSVGANGQHGICLTLTEWENNRLYERLKGYEKDAFARRLTIPLGSKEHPFENIDEAIGYIEWLEKEAVKEDPFLNSSFIKDPYRYDLMAIGTKDGKERMEGLFKIPWASAYTAHLDNPFPKNSFVVTQLNPTNDDWEWLRGKSRPDHFIPLFAIKPNLSGRRFLFRGQNEEYIDDETGLPTCRPTMYRKDAEKNPLPHRIKAYEMACLVARHPLVELLGIKGVKIFNEPFRFQLNRIGLAQHYYNKTSFLDLTSDIEVAKFFACCKYDWESDSYSAYHSDEKLGVIYIYDMRLPGEFNRTELPQLSTIGKQYVFLRSAMQSGFILNMPKDTDLHDLPNVHRIYFRHDRKISEEVVEKTNRGEYYFPKDALSDYWKRMYKAKNSDFRISLKAREMYLKEHPDDFLSMADLDAVLTAEGFGLGENEWPEFPQSLLDDYHENAKVLWERFCSDIYFWGAEGYFMKRALREVIGN